MTRIETVTACTSPVTREVRRLDLQEAWQRMGWSKGLLEGAARQSRTGESRPSEMPDGSVGEYRDGDDF
jgi:hypothetical protein